MPVTRQTPPTHRRQHPRVSLPADDQLRHPQRAQGAIPTSTNPAGYRHRIGTATTDPIIHVHNGIRFSIYRWSVIVSVSLAGAGQGRALLGRCSFSHVDTFAAARVASNLLLPMAFE